MGFCAFEYKCHNFFFEIFIWNYWLGKWYLKLTKIKCDFASKKYQTKIQNTHAELHMSNIFFFLIMWNIGWPGSNNLRSPMLFQELMIKYEKETWELLNSARFKMYLINCNITHSRSTGMSHDPCNKMHNLTFSPLHT